MRVPRTRMVVVPVLAPRGVEPAGGFDDALVLRQVPRSLRFCELFVVDGEERLVGTITYADLHDLAFPEEAEETGAEPAFEQVMRRKPPVLAATDSLEAASRAFGRSMDSHIAVVEDLETMKLAGVVDQRDVMLAFQQAHHAAQAAEEGR